MIDKENTKYGGAIRAIAADDNYVYVGGASTRTVRKLNKSNLSQVYIRRWGEVEYWTGNGEKSCFNCINSAKIRGTCNYPHSPDDPPEAWCSCEDVDEELFGAYTEEELPAKCGHYNPVMVDKCSWCGKKINEPEYKVEYWYYLYDFYPCCSQECEDAHEAEFQKELKSMEVE